MPRRDSAHPIPIPVAAPVQKLSPSFWAGAGLSRRKPTYENNVGWYVEAISARPILILVAAPVQKLSPAG